MSPQTTAIETIKVQGNQLIEQIKQLIHEGNVRRIVIKHGGQTVAEFSLVVGVVGTIFAPILAAIGALAAVLTECTIEVERQPAGQPDLDMEPEPITINWIGVPPFPGEEVDWHVEDYELIAASAH